MRSSVIKFENAVLFQNGSIGDFLMSIFLAELLRESGRVDYITIVVPRNSNFLRGLLGAYPYISAVEVSRRSGWVQILKMMRHPNLVIIQSTLGKIPFRIKLLGWSITRSHGSEFLGFQDKGPLCKTLYSKTLIYYTDQLYSEKLQSIVRGLEAPVLVQVPDLKITPDFKHVEACGLDQRRYFLELPIPSRGEVLWRLCKHVLWGLLYGAAWRQRIGTLTVDLPSIIVREIGRYTGLREGKALLRSATQGSLLS